MQLNQFNKNYVYQSDKQRFDTDLDIWEIIKPNEIGLSYGDCESYCRTLKNKIDGFWGYYYCELNGVGHCILYKNGDIIDCNIKQVVSTEQYCAMFNPTKLKKYNWFVVFSKILVTNMFLLSRR